MAVNVKVTVGHSPVWNNRWDLELKSNVIVKSHSLLSNLDFLHDDSGEVRDLEKDWTDPLQNEEGLPGQMASKHAYANKSVL
jgi:hypothetical protein